MTKAERIFKATRFESKKHIEAFGVEYNPNGSAVGWSNLMCDDNEAICTRTINAVEKELKAARKNIEVAYKLDVISKEKFDAETAILDMVESTIKNARTRS